MGYYRDDLALADSGYGHSHGYGHGGYSSGCCCQGQNNDLLTLVAAAAVALLLLQEIFAINLFCLADTSIPYGLFLMLYL